MSYSLAVVEGVAGGGGRGSSSVDRWEEGVEGSSWGVDDFDELSFSGLKKR